MANQSTPPWPPAAGLTTPNVPLRDAVLTTSASARINAPAALVFETVRDVTNYGEWNNFCPKVTIHSQPDDLPASAKLHTGTLFTLHVVMDSNKPTKETQIQLRVTDISTPSDTSSYIPTSVLEGDETYTTDLSKVYRISWKAEGGFVTRGLRTERFHEIIVLGENECEVRTWENQGGLLARSVRWLYKQTLMEKFQLWCDDLKKYCEDKVKEGLRTGLGGEE